jgi:hypothetical protein
MANADGYIFWYNQPWYDYAGTTPEEMEGWGWQSVPDQELLPSMLVKWKDSIVSEKPSEMVFLLDTLICLVAFFIPKILLFSSNILDLK